MTALGWWDQYRGIPYVQGGADRNGCGCWGLVAMIYREQLGIELPTYSGLACTSDRIAYDQAIGNKSDDDWMLVDKPREFDVVLFRVGSLFHSGVLFDPRRGRFLHICSDISVSVESYKSLAWAKRFDGAWRYRHAA